MRRQELSLYKIKLIKIWLLAFNTMHLGFKYSKKLRDKKIKKLKELLGIEKDSFFYFFKFKCATCKTDIFELQNGQEFIAYYKYVNPIEGICINCI